MFKIKLVDIGDDGCITEAKTSVETLIEAEVVAKELIGRHLRTIDVQLIHDDELVYEVISGGCSVGVVQITTL